MTNFPMPAFKRLGATLLSLMIVACGGGGSSGDESGKQSPLTPTDLLGTNGPTSSSTPALILNTYFPQLYVLDSDIVGSTEVSNDTIPQIVHRGSIVFGTVGSGATDSNDRFRVNLAKGDEVNLHFTDGDLFSLELEKENSNSLIVGSLTTGNYGEPVLSAIVADSGTHTVKIIRNNLVSTKLYHYALSLAGDVDLSQGINSPGIVSTQNFVPNEVIVKFKSKAPPSSNDPRAAKLTQPILAGQANLFTVDELDSKLFGAPQKSRTQEPSDVQARIQTLQMIDKLKQRDDVIYAHPNYIVHLAATATPNDEHFTDQWDLQLMAAPIAWEHVPDNLSDVIVAVIDSGIAKVKSLQVHEDLTERLIPGYDFISDIEKAGDGDGPDSDTTDVVPPNDNTYLSHGTHVTGTIVAQADNVVGIAGVAGPFPSIKVMPVRAIPESGGETFDSAQAILFAAGLDNAYLQDSDLNGKWDQTGETVVRADVINMSWGSYKGGEVIFDALTKAYESGVILVASAGNDRTDLAPYPAGYAKVISVAAQNNLGEIASYSNFASSDNRWLDVTAPGGDASKSADTARKDMILSTETDAEGLSGYELAAGTSMAAPHVAGVFAVMKAINPALTPDELNNLMESGALTNDINESGYDNKSGYGAINMLKAVAAVTGETVAATKNLRVSPASVYVNSNTDAFYYKMLRLYDNYGQQYTLKRDNFRLSFLEGASGYTENSWLSFNGLSNEVSVPGGEVPLLARAPFTQGIYEASVNITAPSGLSNTPTQTVVPVTLDIMNNASPPSLPSVVANLFVADGNDEGTIVDFFTTLQGELVEAANGEKYYKFNFNDLTAGTTYFIQVGTDLDGDKVICEGLFERCNGKPENGDLPSITIEGKAKVNINLH